MFHLVFLCPKRWFQFISRIVRTHFSSKMTLNNCEIIAETGSSRFRRRRRVCLSSLLSVWKDRGALTEGKKVVSNDESNA